MENEREVIWTFFLGIATTVRWTGWRRRSWPSRRSGRTRTGRRSSSTARSWPTRGPPSPGSETVSRCRTTKSSRWDRYDQIHLVSTKYYQELSWTFREIFWLKPDWKRKVAFSLLKVLSALLQDDWHWQLLPSHAGLLFNPFLVMQSPIGEQEKGLAKNRTNFPSFPSHASLTQSIFVRLG